MPEQKHQRTAALRGGFALFAICGLASGCLVSFDGYSARGSGGSSQGASAAAGDESGGKPSGGSKGLGGKSSAGSDSGGDAGETLGGEGGSVAGHTVGGSAGGPAGGSDSGGSSGTGGGGGSGGNSAKDCPVDLEGPLLIKIAKTGGGFYCMDRTEVPSEDYATFLVTNPNPGLQATRCTWNDSFQPDIVGCPTSGNSKYDPGVRPRSPVTCVDWCDAEQYCKWAGKHLCGKIGGGSNPPADYVDAEASEWFRACSNGGAQKFPYGDTYHGDYCNGVDSPFLFPTSVATASNCEGGYDGLFDMSGNAAEWEDSCSGNTGAADNCLIRGGSLENAESTAPSLLCNSAAINDATPSAATAKRNTLDEFIGFRCCLDL